MGACLSDGDALPAPDRRGPSNPLVNTYRTSDGRFMVLGSLQADRYWPRFCDAIGHPEWLEDERFIGRGPPAREHRGVRAHAR